MTTYFSSDTHFMHARILELSNRPFASIEEHDEALIENWNSVITPEDLVYHLGDVALGPWPVGIEKVGRLNGHKILVPGNHDRIASFEKESRRERFLPDYEAVFDEIRDEVIEIHLEGIPFLVSHYPYDGDSHDGDRYTEIRPVDHGLPLIHGHTHCGPEEYLTRSARGSLQVSVGVDAHGYTPVHSDAILELFD